MSSSPGRVWAPERGPVPPADALAGLRIWLGPEGHVLAERRRDELVVLASTGDSPDLAGVPAGTRYERPDLTGLLALVPAGYGLLVDGSSPGSRVVPAAQLDALRAQEPPTGAEPDFRGSPVPPSAAGAAGAAMAAARLGGARRAVALWGEGGGRSGLLVTLHRAPSAAHDSSLAAAAATRPRFPVRVLDAEELPWRAAATVGVAQAGSDAGTPDRAGLLRLVVGLVVVGALVWQAVRALT